MDFWKRLDELLASRMIVIERPKGTTHPRYGSLLYPLDYGYLRDTTGGDGNEIDVWRGSAAVSNLVGVVCTVDTQKSDAEVKLLVGCTAEEIEIVDRFYNGSNSMSGIIVRRA